MDLCFACVFPLLVRGKLETLKITTRRSPIASTLQFYSINQVGKQYISLDDPLSILSSIMMSLPSRQSSTRPVCDDM